MGELNEPYAARNADCLLGRDPERNARLAHAADAGERDQPASRQALLDARQLVGPADEGRRLYR